MVSVTFLKECFRFAAQIHNNLYQQPIILVTEIPLY